ncbi:nucleotide exchange factor GrpE [Thiovibrio frasassiensis]|uniref:Protein GrpE n=1 Tax=Thiovibrio frasassiensis TaxID=2984131 RepID=A0A9X4MHT1_9BACT|nr:nucleotide exchange factor GrpE [Thiovibrio frasassiensis]MDG4476475.1 nucleotide exchange factor GrpE [Thiovibrio frasassiensis]
MTEQEEKNEEVLEQPSSGEEQITTEAEDLSVQLEKALERNRELEDKLLRLAAEQDNFRKRMQRERESAFKYAEENILRELLPFLDNLERAVGQCHASPDADTLLAGVEMTCKGLLSTLEKFGVKPLAGEGQPFDPNFHEAVAMEASADVPENQIIQEYQKGYMFKDRLIRAAKVVVSKGNVEE